ncbi:D-hexose-6-phosphate mutarotase [Actinotalea sp. K2]|uniref:D-hexose-6-phosphate mutarotase n=1 Tax=Actinotalea sp. K2 TaxID=2939438 RepID=UPI0020181FBC|nr:D-hexose-6-phosphate mutarotase [Actinotalea sp. K2]MCL3862247.1 D-hexose-6-phosphate mutarotase [Actinotalea sp. K2]
MPELPPAVTLEAGQGGLPVLRVDSPAARAEVYLQGAHITSWTPAEHPPVLWTSRSSRFEPGRAIRGGVPICFPWFAEHPQDADAPAHGFARTTPWTLIAAQDDGASVELVLRLTDQDRPADPRWPHRFEARVTIQVGAALSLRLDVTNRGHEPFDFEEALHTYLAVPDVREIEVTGLHGAPYVDRSIDEQTRTDDAPSIRLRDETDRLYPSTRATAVVHEPGGRTLRVSKTGSEATVVWNPWVTKAGRLPDMGDHEWTEFVCVETCNVRAAGVRLAPGATHSMTATIETTDAG